MLLFKIITPLLFLLNYGATINAIQEKKTQPIHFIGTWYGGFFASFNCVLHHLLWCEKNNHIPVVYWDKRSLYYTQGFNKNNNVWEYYFEPVSHVHSTPQQPIHLQFTPYMPDVVEFCPEYMDQETRIKAHCLIVKYIKIKPRIQRKIDAFYAAHLAEKKTVAIHIRGTDKGIEEPLVTAEKIVTAALEYADDDAQFFIASDEKNLLNKLIKLLHGRTIVYYDCYRSDTNKPLHIRSAHKPSHAQLGEDVLVEVCLMARCNALIHTLSNVSTGVLYFNPHIPHITVRQDGLANMQ